MRVLFLNPIGQLGGAETSLLGMLAGLRELEPRWDLHLICAAEGPLVQGAADLGVGVTVLPFPKQLSEAGDSGPAVAFGAAKTTFQVATLAPAAALYLLKLRHLAAGLRPDLIHSNGMKMHFLSIALRDLAPVLWHMQDYIGSRPVMKLLLKPLSRACSTIIADSQSVAADLSGAQLRAPVSVIHNSVDMARFHPEGPRCDLDALSGLPPAPAGTVRIGLPATFARWKGHVVFFQAVAALPDQRPVRAYIIGDSIYKTAGSQWQRPELERIAARVCPGRIGFTGFLKEPAPALRSLDIVVHASTQPEPFGMVILEAMACGRPVVASRGGGAVEIFDDEITALTHTPGDSIALARQISRLAADPELRRAMGARARLSVAQRFDLRTMARSVAAVYRSLASSAPAPITGHQMEAPAHD